MSAPAGQREELAWVTWLRVLAIYGVVLIHTVGSTALAGANGETDPVDGWVARALDLPLLWVVPVFVMVSGALVLDPARYPGPGPFLRRRVWRLVPAVVVWHVVYLAYFGLTRDGFVTGPGQALGRVVTGDVAPHLYFLWIVLGLSVLTPVLVPWVGSVGRRGWLVAAVLAWSVPVLSTWPLGPGGAPVGVVQSAWTWWLPYLGAYLMGWALRGVVLPSRYVVPLTALTLGLMTLLTWQWKNPAAPPFLERWLGAHYYGPTVALLCVLVFSLVQATVRTGGALEVLASPAVMRVVRPVGAATLGIFTLHFLVLAVGTDTGLLGEPVTTWPVLMLRFLVVAAVSTVLVLLLRRIPVIRTIL